MTNPEPAASPPRVSPATEHPSFGLPDSAHRKLLPAPVKAAIVSLFREQVGSWVLSKRPPLPAFDAPVSLHLLMSHAACQMGLLALRSFEWKTGALWETFIHDDGTLSDADVAKITLNAPHARIVRRREADARMAIFLKDHPRCLDNRAKHHWFLKFFDSAAFAPHNRYVVLDTDVIFYRQPSEIIEWVRGDRDTCHFMKDAREMYSSPRAKIEEVMGLRLWDAVNSGICLLPKSAFRLDLSEEFLAKFETAAQRYIFLEQTLFALAGSSHGQGGSLPPTYEISWNMRRRSDGVVRHYVGPIKHDLLYVEGGGTLALQCLLNRHRTILT